MSFRFQVEARDGAARAGRFFTPHGEVQTPVFMPVGTLATVKGVPQDTLEELGVQILLNNTYHLYLRPGVEVVRQLGGVQKFMAWDHPILTDSGGFQVFSLSDLRKVTEEGVAFRSHLDGSSHFFSPESAIAAEIGLGADIIMAFDECTEHPAEYARTQASMEMTLRWAARSQKYFEEHKNAVPWFSRGLKSARDFSRTLDGTAEAVPLQSEGQTQTLFGIVQGGMFPDLRRESAQRTVELDFPGYAIGGLSVGEPRSMTYEMGAAAMRVLPEDNARYATEDGPLDPNCACRVCARYSRAYLRHLYASNELLAQVLNTVHNLAYYLDTMRKVRQAILLGEFASFLSGVRPPHLPPQPAQKRRGLGTPES